VHAEERRQQIVGTARIDGRVEVSQLAERFGVTQETIRRDLTELEQRGVLRRIHGGAMPVERFRTEPAVTDRAAVMANEKQRIAKAAVSYLPPGGTVLVDAGTTTGALAGLMPTDRELTVITHSLTIALTLSTRPNIHLLMLGGRVRHRTLANVDDWALRTLADLAVDVAFIATNGMSIERGLSTPDVTEAAVKRAIVEAGAQRVLLADHSKLGEEHLVRFCDFSEVDVLVTDDGMAAEDVARLEEAGVQVVLA
jgi:DeoR family fructose operon transcriptional repressor